MSAGRNPLITNESPFPAARGLASLKSCSHLSDPKQAYGFLDLDPDCDDASVWLRYQDLYWIWKKEALMDARATYTLKATRTAFSAIRPNYPWFTESFETHTAGQFAIILEELEKIPNVLHLDDTRRSARLEEMLRFLRRPMRQGPHFGNKLPGRFPVFCSGEPDIGALRSIAMLSQTKRALIERDEHDAVGKLIGFLEKYRHPIFPDSSTRSSEYKERHNSFTKKISASPSMLPSEEKSDNSAAETPKMFVSYTISEDRSGNADEVMAARLTPLRSRDESSPFARASLALLHR